MTVWRGHCCIEPVSINRLSMQQARPRQWAWRLTSRVAVVRLSHVETDRQTDNVVDRVTARLYAYYNRPRSIILRSGHQLIGLITLQRFRLIQSSADRRPDGLRGERRIYSHCFVIANLHRPTRLSSTVELRCVVSGGMNWLLVKFLKSLYRPVTRIQRCERRICVRAFQFPRHTLINYRATPW